MMGVLGWPPQVFWQATFRETMIAVEGVAMLNGAELPDDKQDSARALQAELQDLMKRYPDG
jgi:hypothetical protein